MKEDHQKNSAIYGLLSCIEQCFSFHIWCHDFCPHYDDEETMLFMYRSVDLLSQATLASSFIAIRKIDDFLRNKRQRPDDIIAADLGIDLEEFNCGDPSLLLSERARDLINKQVAHFTSALSIEPDDEIELNQHIARIFPLIKRLTEVLRGHDDLQADNYYFENTFNIFSRYEEWQKRQPTQVNLASGAVKATPPKR